jgi:hypothetical protein
MPDVIDERRQLAAPIQESNFLVTGEFNTRVTLWSHEETPRTLAATFDTIDSHVCHIDWA